MFDHTSKKIKCTPVGLWRPSASQNFPKPNMETLFCVYSIVLVQSAAEKRGGLVPNREKGHTNAVGNVTGDVFRRPVLYGGHF